MATQANITVNDGKATPLAHTFEGSSSGPNASWRNGTGEFSSYGLLFDERLVVSVDEKPDGLSSVVLTLTVPNRDTVTGEQFHQKWQVKLLTEPRNTIAHRKDGRTMLRNLLDNAQIIDAFDKLFKPS